MCEEHLGAPGILQPRSTVRLVRLVRNAAAERLAGTRTPCGGVEKCRAEMLPSQLPTNPPYLSEPHNW